jgi:DNA end-binding protein Ku
MMTGQFDPKAYRDEYREALMGVIDAKAADEAIAEPAAAPAAKLTDLVAALEASVAAAKAARQTAPETIAAASKAVAATKRSRKLAPVGVPVMAGEPEAGSGSPPQVRLRPARRPSRACG